MAELEQIRAELFSLKNLQRAEASKKYLKSPYNFYGVTVPQLRKVAKKYQHLSVYDNFNLFDELWNSNNHEEMSLALYLLTNHRKNFNLEFWDFLTNEKRINKFKTWDHVDEACSHTLGEILVNNTQLNNKIKEFSQSKNHWIRRISMVSQYPLIKKGKIQLTIFLAEKLCYDEDIYVQKATGWMLREAGKKNPIQVKEFIKIHKKMKPYCLSYATEKMPDFKKLIKEQIKG
ncbi:MAG: DNA alkylation repair protein [archaeon]|nr:DNA alkylation repair protein [archaeon]